jgi:methylated-DNA-[protein]-cysteine S-methyltransferase
MDESFTLSRVATPIGVALILADAEGRLRALDWAEYEERLHRLLRRRYGAGHVRLSERPVAAETGARLAAYFAGDIRALEGMAVATRGTPFQELVWNALRGIAPGETMSYGALARRIGRPAASRAVGLANGANPVGLVIPCHRVIGADLSLTGYGGGLHRKRWLLAHEGAELPLAASAA